MTFITFCRLLSQAVIHSRQPVALNWARNSFGLVLTVFFRKICILGIAEYFLIVLFQISEIQKDEIRFKKYIFLLDMFLIVGGGSSNRNASRDESVEAGDKSVEAGDESIEAGKKTPQSCYNNNLSRTMTNRTFTAKCDAQLLQVSQYIYDICYLCFRFMTGCLVGVWDRGLTT